MFICLSWRSNAVLRRSAGIAEPGHEEDTDVGNVLQPCARGQRSEMLRAAKSLCVRSWREEAGSCQRPSYKVWTCLCGYLMSNSTGLTSGVEQCTFQAPCKGQSR